jgi:hypothetical protein
MRCLTVAFCLLLVPLGASSQTQADRIVLFNGKDLDGWAQEGAKDYKEGDQLKPVWSVKDGNLFCDGKGFGFLRYAKQEFADFQFHVEYRMTVKCNSGIGIRTVVFDPKRSKDTRPSFACYEIQLMDDAGKPPTKYGTGSLYRYVAPRTNPVKSAGQWNVMDIDCRGPRLRISLNGEEIIDVDQSTIEQIKNNRLHGYVCLQNHGGKIEFRNLWVREYKKQ